MIKNILVLEDSSKSKFGGGQKVTLEVINILKESYNLYIFDCAKDTIFIQKAKSMIKELIQLDCYGKIVRGEKSSFSLGIKEVILSPIFYINNIFKIYKFIKKNNFNFENTIIYATTKKQLLLAYVLNKFLKLDYIYHAHTFDDKNSAYFKIVKLGYKKAKKIICVSNLIKNNINLYNCETLYNPIKIIETKPKTIKDKNKIIIASFSTLIKLKGIEYFMKSFNFLNNKEKVEFWIFGEGEEKEFLKKFENENVILKGFCNNVELIMKNYVDIVVMPSITEEACPMVPLEAFKYGIPVISTNIGGQAEIVEDKKVGFLVNINDSKEIAVKIDYIINNPDEYEKLSNNCIEYSKNFDYSLYKKKILNLFGELK